MISRKEIDKELIKQLQEGNKQAFSELFNYYYQHIFNFIQSIVKNRTEAEDLTMITFEKAYIKIGPYAPLFEFRTWLFTIAKRKCFDYLEHKKVNQAMYEKLPKNPKDRSPEDVFICRETLEVLDKAVDSLNEPYKKVIRLHYYEEHLCRDISLELNVPINTILGQLLRARTMLYSLIKSQAS